VEEGSDQAGGAYIYALTDEEAYLQTDDDEKVLEEPMPNPAWFKCWFCRKPQGEVRELYGAQFPVRAGCTSMLGRHDPSETSQHPRPPPLAQQAPSGCLRPSG
jgi:hypothetical protein